MPLAVWRVALFILWPRLNVSRIALGDISARHVRLPASYASHNIETAGDHLLGFCNGMPDTGIGHGSLRAVAQQTATSVRTPSFLQLSDLVFLLRPRPQTSRTQYLHSPTLI